MTNEVTRAIEMILDGATADEALKEAAAVRGVRAKGILNQKQTKQLIINGKARGLMAQSQNFLHASIKMGCKEAESALKHVQQAMDVLNDLCDESFDEAKKDVSHGICRDCYKKQIGKDPGNQAYKGKIKQVCAWCKKVLHDPK